MRSLRQHDLPTLRPNEPLPFIASVHEPTAEFQVQHQHEVGEVRILNEQAQLAVGLDLLGDLMALNRPAFRVSAARRATSASGGRIEIP